VERGGSPPVQRGVQRDGEKSADVHAPGRAEAQQESLAHDGMERGVDCGKPLKQRWDREAYNRYQREYMRRKRSGFIGIAHG
jgi:hypothetical protein